jgi:hypothetical protein
MSSIAGNNPTNTSTISTRIIASNPTTGDVFADFDADPADRRHYRANGYTVRIVASHWNDDTVRDFVRTQRAWAVSA